MEDRGEYAEAERIAREFLPFFRHHAMLGDNSPEALGKIKILTRSIWKQGRYEEGEKLIRRCMEVVQAMERGKFAKYVEDERQMVEADVVALQKWRADQGLYVVIRSFPPKALCCRAVCEETAPLKRRYLPQR